MQVKDVLEKWLKLDQGEDATKEEGAPPEEKAKENVEEPKVETTKEAVKPDESQETGAKTEAASK